MPTPDKETPEQELARLKAERERRNKGKDIPINIQPWYGDSSKSKHSSQEWKEFAKSTGYIPSSADPKEQTIEFQKYLGNHPKYRSVVDTLHSTYGTPQFSGEKYDEKLGKRWDAFIDNKEQPQVASTNTPGVIDTQVGKQDNTQSNRTPFTRNPVQEKKPDIPNHNPWWLQDIIGTAGAAGDFVRVKKYEPWQGTPDTTYVQPTYTDPTRELAAQAEQSNIGAQALSNFAGPRAFNARFNEMQGQGFKAAADTLGRYNNQNVGIANQANQENTGIYNQASQNKAKLNTELFDKYTIANQQFDNAKNQARQNLRGDYIHAVTNKANTQNLNELYPQYGVNPSTGGNMFFHNGKSLYNDPNYQDNVFDKISAVKYKYPNMSDSLIASIMGLKSPQEQRPGLEDMGYH